MNDYFIEASKYLLCATASIDKVTPGAERVEAREHLSASSLLFSANFLYKVLTGEEVTKEGLKPSPITMETLQKDAHGVLISEEEFQQFLSRTAVLLDYYDTYIEKLCRGEHRDFRVAVGYREYLQELLTMLSETS